MRVASVAVCTAIHAASAAFSALPDRLPPQTRLCLPGSGAGVPFAGDRTPIVLLLCMLLLSGAGLLIRYAIRRQKARRARTEKPTHLDASSDKDEGRST